MSKSIAEREAERVLDGWRSIITDDWREEMCREVEQGIERALAAERRRIAKALRQEEALHDNGRFRLRDALACVRAPRRGR